MAGSHSQLTAQKLEYEEGTLKLILTKILNVREII
jgi:hypothetical protein